MKLLIILLSVIILATVACKKDHPYETEVARKIQFSLYTDKDFSDDSKNITFTMIIQNAASTTIWDSVLATMKVNDIPSLENKIFAEKTVIVKKSAELKIGFLYTIEGVGNSWFFGKSEAGDTVRKLDYNFQ
ncbi:MAG: hypothetical protein ABUT20_47185 [Bacteroidota bacterium]